MSEKERIIFGVVTMKIVMDPSSHLMIHLKLQRHKVSIFWRMIRGIPCECGVCYYHNFGAFLDGTKWLSGSFAI